MKTIFRKLVLFFVVIMLSGSLSSCIILVMGPIVQAKAKKELTEEKGAIPPDFGEYGSTLLVAKTEKSSYDKYLEKNFEAYAGKYKIASRADIESKYEDKEEFRFVFDFETERTTVSSSDADAGVRRFYIYDRLNNKRYKAGMTSSFYSKVMKAYIDNLNSKIGEYN